MTITDWVIFSGEKELSIHIHTTIWKFLMIGEGEWWNGGMVEWWNGGMAHVSNQCDSGSLPWPTVIRR